MLTLERLKELVSYDSKTGVFTWRVNRSRRRTVGHVAGGHGVYPYIRLMLDEKSYLAHRLAWFYEYGCWPEHAIDHIDGNPTNNAISNLRDVPQKINAQNQRRPRKHNKCGKLGVSFSERQGFFSSIRVDGKVKWLGSFKTAEQAHEAYVEAKRLLHKGCTI